MRDRLALFTGFVLTAALAALPAQARVHQPHITGVAFSGAPGSYTATVTGTDFGAAPDGIPCTGCTPLQVQVVDSVSQPRQQTVDVTSWSDTAITVSGIAAQRSDGLRIAVYNQTLGGVDAWGGTVLRKKGVPRIDAVAKSGAGKDLTITITGEGFGPAPAQVGQNTVSPYFVFTDWNIELPGTDGFPWNAGFCGTNDCNAVTVGYTSWSDTEIVVTGFGDSYGNDWVVNPHDAFCVGVWPGDSTSGGTTGGAFKCKHVPK